MKRFLKQKLNNRGSGIVTVLVAIVFLTVLGSMLLMLAFTGFEMKVSERKGNQNYYDAEVAMAELRTGFQDACSDAISDSIYDYLVNSSGAELAAEEFAESYIDCIGNFVIKDFEGNDIRVDDHDLRLMINYDKTRSSCEYSVDALAAMVKNCRSGRIIINTYGDFDEDVIEEVNENVAIRRGREYGTNNVTIVRDGATGSLTFSNVCLTYEDSERSTMISTDIVIDVPDLTRIAANLNNADIENFSLVAAGDLVQRGNDGMTSKFIGSVYTNSISNVNGSPMTFDNGTIIVKSDILSKGKTEFEGGNNLSFGTDSMVYVENINVERSQITMNGSTFVANDLTLNGQADVRLGGHYFGFGSSLSNPDKSSSIIISGSKSALNLDSCAELSLCGYCFISDTDDISDNDAITGESISVKPNQMAYLAEPKYLLLTEGGESLAHNPITYVSADYPEGYPEVTLDTEETIFSVFTGSGAGRKEEPRNFAYYGGSLRRVIVNYSSQALVYYFVEFGSTPAMTDEAGNQVRGEMTGVENANEFFKDYFASDPKLVSDFIKRYVTVSKMGSGMNLSGSGFYYRGLENETPNLVESLATSQREIILDKAYTYDAYFTNYKKYLSANVPTDALDPESDYCKSNGMSEQKDVEMFTAEGDKYYENKWVIKEEFDNPFYHKIDYKKISDVSGMKTFLADGRVVAVVCNGDCSFPSDFRNINGMNIDPSGINFIICQGDITIEAGCTYNGLIMCSGSITLDGQVEVRSNESLFNNALNSLSQDGEQIISYFRAYSFAADPNTEGNYDAESSMVFSLVKYKNWKKN